MRQKSEFKVPPYIVYISAFGVSPTSSEIRDPLLILQPVSELLLLRAQMVTIRTDSLNM